MYIVNVSWKNQILVCQPNAGPAAKYIALLPVHAYSILVRIQHYHILYNSAKKQDTLVYKQAALKKTTVIREKAT
jgi:hypothetical protein